MGCVLTGLCECIDFLGLSEFFDGAYCQAIHSLHPTPPCPLKPHMRQGKMGGIDTPCGLWASTTDAGHPAVDASFMLLPPFLDKEAARGMPKGRLRCQNRRLVELYPSRIMVIRGYIVCV